MKSILYSLLFVGFIAALPTTAAVIDRVTGYILLQVEKNGEAYYVDPSNDTGYSLGRPQEAFDIMRERGLGITNADLARIPVDGTSWDGEAALMDRLEGRILLQVEENGEAWYVYPGDRRRYYLGRPTDAFNIMRSLGLGITNSDLSTISIEEIDSSSSNTDSSSITHSSYTIETAAGSFAIQLVKIPRSEYTMFSETGDLSDCTNNCTAHALASYVSARGAAAGIHGSYFCPPDYSSCAGQTYAYNPPFYNSAAGVMINEYKLPFHSGPMIAVATDGTYHYYHRTIDFGYTVEEWESKTGKTLQAAAANYPSLVENGTVIVGSESLDSKMQLKASRGGIGYNKKHVFLVTASSASVPDLAYIFDALGANYAMNLDGGGSTALYSGGGYHVGPGRLLPNAILFK